MEKNKDIEANYRSHEIAIGSVRIGGGNPVAVQSMANCSTADTGSCVEQVRRVRDAGCRIFRFTVPSRREAANLPQIRRRLAEEGLDDVAIVADIHFTAELAAMAADHVDKVRINPGNYRNNDGEFEALLDKCRQNNVALRIGVNHGSLARHIVEQYGDTPAGMVASAMEYLRLCRDAGFMNVAVSMKSSNVRVMVHAYRLLVEAMGNEYMSFPIHLGVTEAGDGMAGRIKSAVGIGAMLADGIGDTIRVSLTEPPENEIPVAMAIVNHFAESRQSDMHPPKCTDFTGTGQARQSEWATEYRRRIAGKRGNIGGGSVPLLYDELDNDALSAIADGSIAVLEAVTDNPAAEWRAMITDMERSDDNRPVILKRVYGAVTADEFMIAAASDLSLPLIDGLVDAVWLENTSPVESKEITPGFVTEVVLMIMQAARVRISSTEYIACPGCGRTLFDLQSTLGDVRRRTSHLTGLKIGVMGCIVNGPGEMADADYGYVGEGAGRVSIYKGRQLIKRGIDAARAIDELIEVIKAGSDWKEPLS